MFAELRRRARRTLQAATMVQRIAPMAQARMVSQGISTSSVGGT